MDITIRRQHYRDFSIEHGDVYEEYEMDLSELWNEHVVEDEPDVYKPFSDLSEDTKSKIKSSIHNQDYLDGETFYDINDWYYHFGSHDYVTYDSVDGNSDNVTSHEIREIINNTIDELKDLKVFDIYVNPLLHAVQSEVDELKSKRELRKVKAEKLIENIRVSLDRSLEQYDKEIESKLMTGLNN